jgi:hypothetical protein
MPHVRLNRTAGARRGMSYVGISERSFADDHERRQRRALNKKKGLIRRAKLLAKSDDWQAAGQELASLHQRWKAIGSAGREHDDKLWAAFRAPTIEFRTRRRRHFAELNRLAKLKASAKQTLIAEAEKLSSAARQAMYDATAQDRLSLQSEYVQRVALRIQRHREILGKARSLRRELTMRRQHVIPGWVGIEMIEEFDERIADIDESMAMREEWLEQDIAKLNQAQDRLSA